MLVAAPQPSRVFLAPALDRSGLHQGTGKIVPGGDLGHAGKESSAVLGGEYVHGSGVCIVGATGPIAQLSVITIAPAFDSAVCPHQSAGVVIAGGNLSHAGQEIGAALGGDNVYGIVDHLAKKGVFSFHRFASSPSPTPAFDSTGRGQGTGVQSPGRHLNDIPQGSGAARPGHDCHGGTSFVVGPDDSVFGGKVKHRKKGLLAPAFDAPPRYQSAGVGVSSADLGHAEQGIGAALGGDHVYRSVAVSGGVISQLA